MKTFLSVVVVGVLLSAFYIFIGYYELNLGFSFLEPLFISDRLQLLFSSETKTLELYYFTYPSLTQLLAVPAAFIDPLLAPMLTSAIATGFFSAYLIVSLYLRNLKIVSILLSLYVLCSPIVLSVATSGTSLYLYLILYYFFFSFLFRYTRDYTTYNFVILSLCLTLFVLLDYNFLWIIIFMIPIIFLFSLYNSPGIKKSYLGIFEELIQQKGTKKELINKSLSTILIVIFTPIISLLCFLIINYWFTGDVMYFRNSETTSWNHQMYLDHIFYDESNPIGFTYENWSYMLLSFFALSPVFMSSFFIGRKKLLFQSIMLLVPIWMIYSLSANSQGILYLSDLLIITAAGIASYIHLFQTRLYDIFQKSKWLYTASLLLLVLTLMGECFYLNYSKDNQEQNMMAFLKQEEPINYKETAELIEYLDSNIPERSKILADNTVFYPSIAKTRENFVYIDQFDPRFYDAIQVPKLYVDYILILNEENSIIPKDKLKNALKFKKVTSDTIYKNRIFSLLEIKD